MDELTRDVARARQQLDVECGPDRIERGLARVHRVARRRRLARRASAVVAVAACVALGVGVWRLTRPEQSTVAHTIPAADRTIRFADGSEAVLQGEESELQTVEVTPQRTTVRLVRGRTRFSVTRSPSRVFSVGAGDITVTVLGTVFTVERRGSRSGVWVDRGRVRVEWPGGATELTAGGHGWFADGSPEEARSAEPPEDLVAPTDEPTGREAQPRPAAGPDWRTLARGGEYEAAFEALRQGGVSDRPDDLLLAADVARLSGHPEAALRYLNRVARRHPRHQSAPLAAFTAGRVLLDSMGRPARAAREFHRAGRLDPPEPLAEDALAREVEAWSRAGDTERASEAARRYMARYPNGRRARAVQRYGGLE